jgi:hypothetical protein
MDEVGRHIMSLGREKGGREGGRGKEGRRKGGAFNKVDVGVREDRIEK